MATVQARATVRSRATRRHLRASAAFGALLLVGAVSACSGQPGAAAVVDGRTISVEDVQNGTRELAPFYQGVTPSAVLTVLVEEPTVTAFASAHGVGVSDQQARDALAGLSSVSVKGSDSTFTAPSVAVERYLLAQAAVQALADAQTSVPALQKQIADLHVDVSTRFGTVASGNAIVDAV